MILSMVAAIRRFGSPKSAGTGYKKACLVWSLYPYGLRLSFNRFWLVSLSVFISSGFFCTELSAQTADPIADELFKEGSELFAKRKIGPACAKFEESYNLQQSLGSLAAMAACHKEQGRFATALSEFRQLAEQPDKNVKRKAYAKEQAQELEKSVSKLVLTMQVPPQGLVLLLDGKQLSSAVIGSELPVDAGEHSLSAMAPNRKRWNYTVLLANGSGRTVIEIPSLQETSKSTSETSSRANSDVQKPDSMMKREQVTLQPGEEKVVANQNRTGTEASHGGISPIGVAGLVIGGVGLAVIAGGVVMQVLAQSAKSDADQYAPSNFNNSFSNCTAAKKVDCEVAYGSALDTADSRQTAALGLFIGGGLAVVGGAIMFFAAPNNGSPESDSKDKGQSRFSVKPDVRIGTNRGYVGLVGTF